jgi:hypothetical protein
MAVRTSPGLRAALLSDYGLLAMMNFGVIEVYSGPQPLSAALAPTGTLLGRVTTGGVAFVPGSTTGGLEVELDLTLGLIHVGDWRLTGLASGTIGWWRWMWNSVDPGADSQFFPRMDGAYGESLWLPSDTVSPSTDVAITSFKVNILE